MNIVFNNKWFKVIERWNPDGSSYFIKHENHKVAILPYWFDGKDIKIYTLIEPISNWGSKNEATCVTGTIEKGDEHFETAVRELQEEIGFHVHDEEKWDFVGEFGVDKGQTAKRYLYLVDVFQSEIKGRPTDGSYFEKKTKVVLSGLNVKHTSKDIVLHYLISKLEEKIKES